MSLSQTLASLQANPAAPGAFDFTAGEDWLQGRSLFGGLQLAVAVQALRRRMAETTDAADLPLRVAHTIFCAPVPAGRGAVQARILRRGKSTVHGEARLLVDGVEACVVLAVFGRARPSQVRLQAPPAPAVRAVEAVSAWPYLAGVMPAFTQHIDFRWAEGGSPFSGAAEARFKVWLALRDAEVVDESAMLALADAIPSPALSILKAPAMASSLTWTLDMLCDDWQRRADGHWRMDAEVTAAADGYASQTGTFYDPDGRAVALSRQIAAVFG